MAAQSGRALLDLRIQTVCQSHLFELLVLCSRSLDTVAVDTVLAVHMCRSHHHNSTQHMRQDRVASQTVRTVHGVAHRLPTPTQTPHPPDTPTPPHRLPAPDFPTQTSQRHRNSRDFTGTGTQGIPELRGSTDSDSQTFPSGESEREGESTREERNGERYMYI